MPNDQVQLKRLENDWVEIRSGKSVFKIVGMDAKEFPQFPQFDSKWIVDDAGVDDARNDRADDFFGFNGRDPL